MSDDRAYVTVLSYPPDLSVRERMVALSEALKIDDYTAELAQRWETPAIVKICPSVEARDAVRALEELGISAYAARQSALDKLGDPIVVKRLLPALGAPRAMYGYEPLRPRLNQPGSIVMSDVFAVIEGRVRERRSVTTTPFPSSEYNAGGHQTGPDAGPGGGTSRISSRASERYLIDLYLVDARRIRIDTGQFNFDFLEGKLGYTDLENFQRARERLRAESPQAIFDNGFEGFRPPPNASAHSSRTFGDSSVTILDSQPAFDFYSVWRCLLLIHLRKRGNEHRPVTPSD